MTDPLTVRARKDVARQAILGHEAALVALSHDIHAHPEVRFQERQASTWASAFLEERGFAVSRELGGLATAFDATVGTGDLVLALCAEYDALPEIGHACGHNLICASSIGAALGMAAVADELGLTVRVIGTPGEEGGGGKSLLLDAGAFDGVHAALMAHPSVGEADLLDMGPVMLASIHLEVTYTGRPAHAAAAPQDGINALDAAIVAQTAIGLLRQQLPSGDLVHGFVRHGGDAANIIPERTELEFLVRSATLERARVLEGRVRRCFEAGALATGCEMEMTMMAPDYSHLEADRDLSHFYGDNARALGRAVIELPPGGQRLGAGSTDMGNVSLAMPAIHPAFGIPGARAIPHHPDYAAACATPDADAALIHAATALAWTGIDAAADPEVRARLLHGERLPISAP
jgi:amidohydrolase